MTYWEVKCMFESLFGWKSILADVTIDDVKSDRKDSKRVEMYYISQNAIYFQGKYLPLSEIKSVCVFPSVYRPHHSSGKGLPAFKLKIDYNRDKPLVLLFERERNANRAAVLINGRNPRVRIDRWVNPLTGGYTKEVPPGFW